MKNESGDISGFNKDKEHETLLNYLNKNMSDEAQHEFEKKISDDEFMSEAVEGLEEVKNKNHLELLVRQLNNDLKKQVNKKRTRIEKRKLKEQPWVYLSIILLLMLIITTFLILKKLI